MKVPDAVVEAGFGAGWAVLRRFPDSTVRRLSRVVADRAWSRQGTDVLQLKANLSRVLSDADLPRLDEIAQENLRLYMRYWVELFQLSGWSPDDIQERFCVDIGLHHMDDAYAAGNGVIVVLPHSGNWDLAGFWACLRYDGVITVAERLRPEGLFDKFVAFRESFGVEVLPLGDPMNLRILVRRLREGRMLCLLADRDISHTGQPVSFFGEEASMPAGPAALAILTGAPLLPGYIRHTEVGAAAQIYAPLPIPQEGTREDRIRALTQSMADAFAASITERPVDWHMMQRLWSTDIGTRS